MIANCGIITVMSWAILLVLVSEIKCEGEKKFFRNTVVFTKYVCCSLRCSLKQKANGFPFQILLGNRSMHIRHPENQSSSLDVLEVTAHNISRHVLSVIFVICVYVSKKRKEVFPTLKNQQRT